MKKNKCRICGRSEFEPIINLGYQKYTGVFPKGSSDQLSGGELELVKCVSPNGCGLVQLSKSFDSSEMYGENYGYHSSLNSSMVEHLNEISKEILEKIELREDDVILDIGSNDGTLLSTYINKGIAPSRLLGIDPSGGKFKRYYPKDVRLVEDFFSASNFKAVFGETVKAKVVTSIAMFYDLENPIAFAEDVESILDDNGIWVIEQSYLPLMVATKSYDTICHEHIEFYSFKQIDYIADHANLKVIGVSTNDTNGGSFRVVMSKKEADIKISDSVEEFRRQEEKNGVDQLSYFSKFREEIEEHKQKLVSFLQECKKNDKLVLGYGASTKGNVVLQYCGIDKNLMSAIVEVNSDKFGCVTPGTNIPIISETEGKAMYPDYFVVLPWHFKENILKKEEEYRRFTGVKFVFYLPEFQIV